MIGNNRWTLGKGMMRSKIPKKRDFLVDREHTLEVHQHEWEVSTVASGKSILATTHIRWCTGFYGHDKDHSVGFLAHFDWPFSERAIPEIFRELERKAKGRPPIECFLIGGWKCSGYSDSTRWLITKRVNDLKNDGWNINTNFEVYSNEKSNLQIRYWTMPFQFNIKTGELSSYSRHRTLRKKGVPLKNLIRISAQRRPDTED